MKDIYKKVKAKVRKFYKVSSTDDIEEREYFIRITINKILKENYSDFSFLVYNYSERDWNDNSS